MGEEEHRQTLSEIRKVQQKKNKSLKIEVTRLNDRNSEMRPEAVHYMMKPNGDIAFKTEAQAWDCTSPTDWSTNRELIAQHAVWFSVNRGLLSFQTFIGKRSNPGWKYTIMANQDNIGLLDMPLEVFENLVWYVDGFSFYNLCKASSVLEVYLNEALNEKQYDMYWNLRKNDLEASYAAKMVSSFLNSTTMGRRLGGKQPEIIWSKLFKLCVNLNSVIEESALCLESLVMLEKSIKAEMKLGFMYLYPQRFTFPCGSMLCTLYNDIPNDENDENIIIMEDMDPKKAFRMGTVCRKTKIHNVHVMTLMQKNNEVVTLIITVCCRCTCVYPVMEGSGLSIPMEYPVDDDDEHSPSPFAEFDLPPPPQCFNSNIYRDVLGIIVNASLVELYRISYVKGQVYSEQLHKINLLGFSPLIDDIRKWRKHYMVTVSEIDFPAPMSAEEKSYYETAEIEPPLMKGYGLSIISCHRGHFLIRPENSKRIQTISYSSVCKMSPIYYKGDYKDIKSLKYLVGSCSGHGMYLFWTDEAMAVSFDSVTWHIKSFYDGVRLEGRSPHYFHDESRLKDTRFVVSVKICSPDLILVAIDKQLVFISVKLETYKNSLTTGYPRLVCDVIRRIDFDLSPLNLSLKSMYFDFVRGDPYIFVELHDDNKLGNPLKFQFKRILLKRNEDKNDSGYASTLDDSLSPSKP